MSPLSLCLVLSFQNQNQPLSHVHRRWIDNAQSTATYGGLWEPLGSQNRRFDGLCTRNVCFISIIQGVCMLPNDFRCTKLNSRSQSSLSRITDGPIWTESQWQLQTPSEAKNSAKLQQRWRWKTDISIPLQPYKNHAKARKRDRWQVRTVIQCPSNALIHSGDQSHCTCIHGMLPVYPSPTGMKKKIRAPCSLKRK